MDFRIGKFETSGCGCYSYDVTRVLSIVLGYCLVHLFHILEKEKCMRNLRRNYCNKTQGFQLFNKFLSLVAFSRSIEWKIDDRFLSHTILYK